MSLLKPLWLQNENFPAALDRQLISVTATQGVVDAGSLVVSERGAGANMSVDVAAGSVVIEGTQASNQESYLCKSTGVENLVIAAAPGSGDRIDLVVARVKDTAVSGAVDAFELEVVTGTASGSPVAPAAPDSSVILAEVLVGQSVSQITVGDITDVRPRSKPYLLADGLTMDSGDITMDGQNINLSGGGKVLDPSDPSAPDHLTRKSYVDNTRVNKAGDTMSGALNMDTNALGGLPLPTLDRHAAPKEYVDDVVFGSVARQTLDDTENIAMGAGSKIYASKNVSLPSGWNSMLVLFNGQFEWALKNYDRARYVIWLELTSGTAIDASTDTIVTPGGNGVWDYNAAPMMGTYITSSDIDVRYRTLNQRLDGTGGSDPNVLSTRRRLTVVKFRLS